MGQDLAKRIRRYADCFYEEHGRSPSTSEIARAVGASKGTVYRYLVEMDKTGVIEYDGKSIVTDRTGKVQTGITPVRVFRGAIPCGPPETIEASVSEVIYLPTSVFGTDPLYVVYAQGDSMTGAGIEDGDMIVIRQQNEASIGDIVVALDCHGQNTLKRLCWDRECEQYYLHPENPQYQDIYVRELTIQGVAMFVWKRLR